MLLNHPVEQSSVASRIDWNLVMVIFTLNAIGLINLYSATHGVTESINTRLFWQQLVWLTGGWIAFISLTFVDYQVLKRVSWLFYLANVLALVAVMFVGKSFYGAQRWLDLGFFRFQPSETVKLSLVLLLSQHFANHSYPKGLGIKDLFVPMILIGIPFVLTVKQPDLGTALLIGGISMSIIFFIGVKRNVFLSVLLTTIIAAPIAWKYGLKTYQKNRVLTFISPDRDPRGSGYNSIQSKIAVGSGQVWGKGFRKGTQSQLEFIPERHSDFIYSVLSEEYGFIGSVSVLGLFALLFMLGIKVASSANDKFGCLITVGSLSIIFWHMFINIGMVIGVLPIVGVPLPLLSYGGSSLIASMASLGIISSVAYRKYLF